MLTTVNVNQYDLTEIEVLYSMGTNRIKVNPRIKGDEGALVALVVKNLHANAGNIRNVGLIPGLGRSPGGGNGNPLQYSCLEDPMDTGAWQATAQRAAKSRT